MENVGITVYKKRYFILFCYCLLIAFHCGSASVFAIIANILVKYYNVSKNAINVSTISTNVLQLVLLIPSGYATKKLGIRFNVILGSAFLFTGNIVKCFAVNRHLYAIAVFGQYIVAAGTSFSVPICMQIASVWFPANQFSTVSSIINAAITIACTLVSFTATQLIPEDNIEAIEVRLGYFFSGQALVSAIILLVVVLFFDEKPPTPPSLSEMRGEQQRESISFWDSLRGSMNKNFIIVVITASVYTSLWYAYGNIRNFIFTTYFKNKVNVFGIMLFTASLFAVPGMIACGYILDKIHCYKSMYVISTSLLCLSYSLYYTGLHYEMLPVLFVFQITDTILHCGIVSVYNLAQEVNYPMPGNTTVTIITIMEQILAIFFTFVLTAFITHFGCFFVYLTIIVLMLGTVFLYSFAKVDLRRLHEENRERDTLV